MDPLRCADLDRASGRHRATGASADFASARSTIDAGGGRAYHNRIIRYWLYLFGHAANENEFVRVIVNGGNAALREDVEPNANDFLKRNWEDGRRGRSRIDDEWWFRGLQRRRHRPAQQPQRRLELQEQPGRHQRVTDPLPERMADALAGDGLRLHQLHRVVKALNTGGSEADLDRLMDHNLNGLNAAVRGYDGDWDTLTLNRGKNGYFYRKPDGKWMLVHWDGDRTFENTGETILGGARSASRPTSTSRTYAAT